MTIDAEKGPIDKNGNVPLTIVIDEGDVHTVAALHATKLGAPLEKEDPREGAAGAARAAVRAHRARRRPHAREGVLREARSEGGHLPPTDVHAQKHAIDITLVVEPASN